MNVYRLLQLILAIVSLHCVQTPSLVAAEGKIRTFEETFEDFPRAYWYGADNYLKSLKQRGMLGDPDTFNEGMGVSNLKVETVDGRLIGRLYLGHHETDPDPVYFAFKFQREKDAWSLIEAVKIAGEKRSDLFANEMFAPSMERFLKEIVARLNQDPEFYKKKSAARFEGHQSVDPTILIGENGSGSGFLIQYQGEVYVVCTLHQFDDNVPSVMLLPDGDEIQITGRLARGEDVQLLTFDASPLAPDIITLKLGERLEEDAPIALYGFNTEGAIECTYSGDFVYDYQHKMTLRKRAAVRGMSGSPVVNASTGAVVGVLTSADSPSAAQSIFFEELAWVFDALNSDIVELDIHCLTPKGTDLSQNTTHFSYELGVIAQCKDGSRNSRIRRLSFDGKSQEVTSPHTDTVGDFGAAIASDGNYLLIGDYADSLGITYKGGKRGKRKGAAFLYSADGLEFVRELCLPDILDSSRDSAFGREVALAGDYAFVSYKFARELVAFSCSTGEIKYRIDTSSKRSFMNLALAANSTHLFIGLGGSIRGYRIDTGEQEFEIKSSARVYLGERIAVSDGYLLASSRMEEKRGAVLYDLNEIDATPTDLASPRSNFDSIHGLCIDSKGGFCYVADGGQQIAGFRKGVIYKYDMEGGLARIHAVSQDGFKARNSFSLGWKMAIVEDRLIEAFGCDGKIYYYKLPLNRGQ